MTIIPGSWPHATAVALVFSIALAAAFAFKPRRRNRRVRRPAPMPCVVDYSAARAKAIEWLGDDYLLAHPINEKGNRSCQS